MRITFLRAGLDEPSALVFGPPLDELGPMFSFFPETKSKTTFSSSMLIVLSLDLPALSGEPDGLMSLLLEVNSTSSPFVAFFLELAFFFLWISFWLVLACKKRALAKVDISRLDFDPISVEDKALVKRANWLFVTADELLANFVPVEVPAELQRSLVNARSALDAERVQVLQENLHQVDKSTKRVTQCVVLDEKVDHEEPDSGALLEKELGPVFASQSRNVLLVNFSPNGKKVTRN